MVPRPATPLVAVPVAAASVAGERGAVTADAPLRVRCRERLWREVALYLEFFAIAGGPSPRRMV